MANFAYYCEMAKCLRPAHAAPKLWNYLKYRCLKKQVTTSVRRYSPQIASLLVTVRCNLNCGYCSTAKMLREGRGNWRDNEVDLEKIQRIFSNPLFRNCLLVDLLGGEPLLVEDFDRIVAYLTQHGHITNTSTNGLLLAERVADLKRAAISRINVSVYDANYSVLQRDLPKINRIFSTHSSFVMLRSDVEKRPEKIIEIIRFVRESGCLSMRLWMYRPVGDHPRFDEIMEDTNPAYLEFRRRVEEVFPGFCVWPAAVQRECVKKRCPQLWQRVACDAQGTMAICCGMDVPLRGPNSNLFDAEPDVVFNHPTLVSMRRQLLDPKSDPPTPCKTCNLLGDPGW